MGGGHTFTGPGLFCPASVNLCQGTHLYQLRFCPVAMSCLEGSRLEGSRCLEAIISKIKYFYEQEYAVAVTSPEKIFLGCFKNMKKRKG